MLLHIFVLYQWKELLEFFGTEINHSTTSHHETVGKSKGIMPT